MPPEVVDAPAPAPAAPDVTAAAPAAPAPAPAPSAAPAPAVSALDKPQPLHERIPEKFHVKKGEEFDAEASMGKVLESYKALEQRMLDGGAPPKAPEEYKITPPDDLKDTWQEDERTASFRKDAHAKGLSQEQFDWVMGKYFELTPTIAGQVLQNTADQTRGALEEVWGDEYQANFDGAMKTFKAYAPEGAKFDDIMTKPALAYQMLAKISTELGEAGGVPRDTSGGSDATDVQTLLMHPAAGDPKHAEHKAVRQKLDAYYAKKYGTTPVV